ncbi:hypothetical protein HHK36_002856 [Tetracentron sinense]|uniref:NAC domain-containing protein n=1 Tax=Tetracentron sinense TaxID=13715 RepID=A0A835DRJ8_TETSI|nr:hypothetical protein HHK36_002856 [Tetracentron sinense]
MEKPTPELDLPGFRFHPTEEELLDFYLKNMVFGNKPRFDVIGFLNIYHHDPWDLPGLAKIGEREWYFFVPRDRKHGNGGRPNRTTEHGFWKATGSDRPIRNLSDPKRIIGLRKTLVFYHGRAPRGSKTDWVMNEYRMPDNCSLLKEDIVLCKIYRKATSLKVLEQRAAMEEEIKTPLVASSSPPSTMDTVSSHDQERNFAMPMPKRDIVFKIEEDVKDMGDTDTSSSLRIGSHKNLPELQVPKFSSDWTQDPYWTQLRSPWLDNWAPYANVLNF